MTTDKEEINVVEIARELTKQGILLTDFISYSAYSAVEKAMHEYAKSKLEAKDKECASKIAAGDRLRVEDAMSAINEANGLRQQITDLKAEIERLKEQNEKLTGIITEAINKNK